MYELELTIPRGTITILCSFEYDDYNGYVENFTAYHDGNELDLDGLYVETSPFGSLETKYASLEAWLKEECARHTKELLLDRAMDDEAQAG